MTEFVKNSSSKSRVGSNLLTVLIVVFFTWGLFVRCANIMSPSGGPIDSLPPVIVSTSPNYGTTNFSQKRITITFDEYVQLKDLQKEFFISPFMGKKPSVTLRGRGIQIDLQDTLQQKTTYSLNFGSAVADNNEGNPLNGLRYVFSTGDKVDSMAVSGYTADAYRGDSIGKVFIMFYPAIETTLNPNYDSTLLKTRASSAAKSSPNGTFLAQNLKPIDYRIYAFEDKNSNQKYDPGLDKVAFLDSIYNPTSLPDFSVWYDTTRRYAIADPQLYFRLFLDEGFKRQYMTSSKRTVRQKIELQFNAPNPVIQSLTLEGIDSSRIITQYLTKGRDSIALWLNVQPTELPDTIRGSITYLRHDSLSNIVPITQSLKLGWWEAPESKKDRQEREEREKLNKPKPNLFHYSVQASSPLNPQNNIGLEFDYPLASIDSTNIELIRIDGQREFDVKFRLQQDSLNVRRWTISAPWVADKEYSLMIPAGVFTDIANGQNDTLRSKFTVASPDKYAKLVFNVKGKTPQSQYVLQLTNTGGQLIQEIRHAVTGKYTLLYVEPGMVKLRIVEDDNANGMWDKGNLIKRIQPERVEICIKSNGEQEIMTRVNWEEEIDLDMDAIFAPVTMERLIQQLQAKETARLRKLAKEMEKARKNPKAQQNKNESEKGSSGGLFGSGGTPSLPGFRQ